MGRVVPGSVNVGGYPFFSPDGRFIVFVSHDDELMRVSPTGEPPLTLCPLPDGRFDGGT